ncbi:EamA-like transporter family protein [Nitrospirillum amazonense]|uniref:EamA-like transporter family protein n=1 Tax=Nitrospirillum amazonense TaxID=28077 RepID=A0A560FSN4_9PROT|nr:DMT family transporter [Nitrospirillum amazonense]TWB24587.1 EamA-like transporter family protein [Nitrospirillum amazonense]
MRGGASIALRARLLGWAAPWLFILIWSTGFLVGRAVLPYADVQLFLVARFGLTAVLFAGATLAAGVSWPHGRAAGLHLVAGALMQGVYIGFSYWAIAQGLAAGIMALMGALQPLFTVLITTLVFRQRLSPRAWAGLGIGFAGVACVLAPRLVLHATAGAGSGGLPPLGAALAVLSVLSITIGTLLQKSSVAGDDLRPAGALQNLGALCVVCLLFLAVGTPHWDPHPVLWTALAWAVLGPSVIGISLLVWMVRHGEATRATALLLLVPPLAALEAFFLFHETLTPLQLAGFALALGGVGLTRRG